MRQLGDVLLESGLVTAAQLTAACDDERTASTNLGRHFVATGILTDAQLLRAWADQLRVPAIELKSYPVDPSAVALLPAALCRRHAILPVSYSDGRLLLAMADPSNVVAIDDVRSLTKMPIQPAVAVRTDLLAAIDRHHQPDTGIEHLASSLTMEQAPVLATPAQAEDAPVIRFVNLLIHQAVQTWPRTSTSSLESTSSASGSGSTACCTR